MKLFSGSYAFRAKEGKGRRKVSQLTSGLAAWVGKGPCGLFAHLGQHRTLRQNETNKVEGGSGTIQVKPAWKPRRTGSRRTNPRKERNEANG